MEAHLVEDDVNNIVIQPNLVRPIHFCTKGHQAWCTSETPSLWHLNTLQNEEACQATISHCLAWKCSSGKALALVMDLRIGQNRLWIFPPHLAKSELNMTSGQERQGKEGSWFPSSICYSGPARPWETKERLWTLKHLHERGKAYN